MQSPRPPEGENPSSEHVSLFERVERGTQGSGLKTIRTVVVGMVAAMSGVLFGFDASIAAACGNAVNTHFGLAQHPGLQGLWVACVPLGALFGALLGGRVAGTLGRQKGLLLNAFLFIGGILLAALSPNFGVFIAARLLMGFAIGNSAVITPMYMAEVAPPESRGRILFLYQLSIVIGILVSFLVGVLIDGFVPEDNISWRLMIGVGLVPAFLFLFGMLRMPKSPRWLLEKGRFEEGYHILLRMMGKTKARQTFSEIHQASTQQEKAPFSALFGKLILPVLLLGVFLQLFQQSTGINADMYFGPEIFREGGFNQSASMWAQVAMGVVNLVATVGSIFLVDRLGRRKLMVLGVTGIVAMLCVQSYLFHRYEGEQASKTTVRQEQQSQLDTHPAGQRHVLPNTGTAVTHKGHSDTLTLGQDSPAKSSAPTGTSSQTTTYLIFGSILLYIVFFAISAGPLCWLIISEIFPIRFRGIGMSIAVAANWLMDYLVSQLFPMMKAGLGMPVTTLIYAGITAVGLALAIKYLPETKGVPLEKIEANIYAGKPLREIGLPRK